MSRFIPPAVLVAVLLLLWKSPPGSLLRDLTGPDGADSALSGLLRAARQAGTHRPGADFADPDGIGESMPPPFHPSSSRVASERPGGVATARGQQGHVLPPPSRKAGIAPAMGRVAHDAAARQGDGGEPGGGRSTSLAGKRDGGLPPPRLSATEMRRLLEGNPLKIDREERKSEAPVAKRPRPTPPPSPKPGPERIKLRLVGTIAGSGLGWAVIRDLATNEEGFYAPGDLINDHASLVEVRRSEAVVLVNGRRVKLTIDWKGEGSRNAAARGGAAKRSLFSRHRPRSGVLAEPRSAKAGRRVYVSKQDLNSNFRNLSQLLTQMRVQPYFEKGRPAGFLISSVRRGSFVERLGARSGDIIKEVNGEKVDSVQKAFKLYNAFKNNDSVKITIMRKGRPQTLEFAIR